MIDNRLRCSVCGELLEPGRNWYTMKPDHVCTKCSGRPNYPPAAGPQLPSPYELDEAYELEEAILERQDMWLKE